MSNLIELSVTEMREGLLKRDFSSTELVQAHLNRIDETNAPINSFVNICRERALTEAKAADEKLKSNAGSTPALLGIPVGLKDNLVTKDIETTCCSQILKGFIPPYECTAVARLRNAGAVVLGKNNMDQFGMGSSTENSIFGSTKNPWDLARVPGGTSGGSAAAVAAGQVPLALGTDTGGSIRQPSSFTGIVGLKPTYGRVSRFGAIAYGSSLEQIGPMARNVNDLALTMEAIAGFDENDSTSMKVEVPKYSEELKANSGQGLKGLRVGVPKEYFIAGMDKEVEQSVRDGIKVLAGLGAEIIDISLPHTEHALSVYYIVAPAEASSNLARYDGVRYGYRAKGVNSVSELYEQTRAEGFGDEVKRRILVGTYVLSAGYYDAYYLKAQQVRTLIINDFKKVFANQCDVIATPVSPFAAFKIGEKQDDPLQMYLADIFTITANLAGIPGVSIPCGKTNSGLPIGMQLLAAPFAESKLLQAADAFLKQQPFSLSDTIKRKY